MNPGISCVIPVYNGRNDLRRAIDSALMQRSDVQVIVVDDCSTDGTGDLATEIAESRPGVEAIRLATNRGQGYARNVGAEAAKAPHITFLDHDDEHIPGWYDYAIGELERNPEWDAIKGDMELVGAPPDISIDRQDPRWSAMLESVMWNVVVRRDAYHALGGCPTEPIFRLNRGSEDVAFMMALTANFTMARTDYPSTQYRLHPTSAAAFFLRRTRPTASGFEFIEQTAVEADASLQAALANFQAAAAARVAAMRGARR